jgi:archaellum component FlaF (FlaF/FlaG flagellin family)
MNTKRILTDKVEQGILYHIGKSGFARMDEASINYYKDKHAFEFEKFVLMNNLEYVVKDGIYTITKINNICINCD